MSEILIRQADRRDSALFSCVASNAYGRDDTNIQLIVQGKAYNVGNIISYASFSYILII